METSLSARPNEALFGWPTAVTILIGLFVPALGFIGVPSEAAAVVFLVTLTVLSSRSPAEGIAVALFFNAFSTLFRISNSSSLLLAGLTTLSNTAAVIGTLAHLAVRPQLLRLGLPRDRLDRAAWMLACVVACFTALMLLSAVRGATGSLRFALLVREHLVPAVLFVIAALTVRKPAQLEKLLLFFGIGAALVATVNVVHYFFGIDQLQTNRFVVHSVSSVPAIRQFLILQAVRLYHILGLSTQGGGAVYYGLAAIGVYYVGYARSSMRSHSWLLPLFVLILTGVLTFSNSWLVLLVAFLAVEMYRRSGRNLRLIVAPAVAVAAALVIMIPGVTGHQSVVVYAYDAFLAPGLETIQSQGAGGVLAGEGLSLISGGLVGAGESDVSAAGTHIARDRWLLVVQLQMGVVGLLLAALVIGATLHLLSATKVLADQKAKTVVQAALLLILLSLSFAHGFSFLERLFSPIMYALVGGVIGVVLADPRCTAVPSTSLIEGPSPGRHA
jgi:hypothetical protein